MVLDSAEAFDAQAAGYRRELFVHCYRMLGTVDEAEDAVQEALARAWEARETFRRSVSFRAWLYRIATNVCLNAIQSRKRDRVERGLAIEPCPDNLLTVIAAPETGPEASYDAHESISLAFLTVLQVLPARQRAVLLLRDVLSFRAAEVGALLEMSAPAVNSALQRARATLRSTYRAHGPAARRSNPRPLLERYVRAWEAADVAGLVALLRADAILAMPPKPMVVGAKAIGDFLAQAIFPIAPMRLIEVQANRSPAYVAYMRQPGDNPPVAFALLMITGEGHQVTQIDAFADQRVLARFAPPMVLAG